MVTDSAPAAHAIVAAFSAGGAGAWRLDRAAVADRLHDLIEAPGLVRQGGLNLCGPAAMLSVWLSRDPVAAVTYAARLFEDGRAPIGAFEVVASPRLRAYDYAAAGRRAPQADWMMMSALRDATNRVLRYDRVGGVREAAAAITLPGAMRRWFGATGLFAAVHDETWLIPGRGLRHARTLHPDRDQVVVVLVALEMLRQPASRLRRARDAIVGLVPNHWIVLREPVADLDGGRVGLRFWSWGEEHGVSMPAARLARGYFGALVAQGHTVWATEHSWGGSTP